MIIEALPISFALINWNFAMYDSRDRAKKTSLAGTSHIDKFSLQAFDELRTFTCYPYERPVP